MKLFYKIEETTSLGLADDPQKMYGIYTEEGYWRGYLPLTIDEVFWKNFLIDGNIYTLMFRKFKGEQFKDRIYVKGEPFGDREYHIIKEWLESVVF